MRKNDDDDDDDKLMVIEIIPTALTADEDKRDHG
jgi:hypothetical protein